MSVFHHVELWVADWQSAAPRWDWLLGELGWARISEWHDGASWGSTDSYLVIEQSPDVRPATGHDRVRPGLNHLALWAGSTASVDRIWQQGPSNGWRRLFTERHPYAGGDAHYAAYLEDDDGFEAEIVAPSAS